MIQKEEKTIFSVSQLNRQAKQLLETHLPLIWVSGELSNLSRPSSGHWYFTLKDERAQIRCAMFRNANQRLRWQPEAGKQVLVRTRVSLYEGRGDYQLIVEHMEDAGAGNLQQAFEALKIKLQQEGLFDPAHKKPLPRAPKHIAVITSPTGAAIQDILSVLARRYPVAQVSIVPVAVQGEGAASEITAALIKAEQTSLFDLIMITRGGGSIEDLWPFNDEGLARQIARSSTPVISAVGHEIDFTICDFVADYRAPTPSASAEVATPDIAEWQIQLDRTQTLLHQRMLSVIKHQTHAIATLGKRLRHPKEIIQAQLQHYQSYQTRLKQALTYFISNEQRQISYQQQRLANASPEYNIDRNTAHLAQQLKQLQRGIQSRIDHKQSSIVRSAGLLEAVSPLKVLSRGYAVVSNTTGEALTSSDHIVIGETITTQLSEGTIKSKVLSKEP